MKELLSNEEIDTLLDMFRSEGGPPEESSRTARAAGIEERTITPLDLLQPNRLSREQARALERQFANVAKGIGGAMSERLRLDVRCDCVAVEQLRFGTWLEMLSGPTAIYEVQFPPLQGTAQFTVTTSLLYGAVDRVLGGTGKVQKVPVELSAAEYTVADALLGPCLERIVQGLGDLVSASWQIGRRYCNPALAQIMAEQEVVLAAHFQVGAEHLVGDLRLVLPYGALEPHLGNLDRAQAPATARPRGTMRQKLSELVRAVPVELAVVLGNAQLPLRQLLALRTGDVVPLDTRLGAPLVAPVEGKPKFTGSVGTRGNRYAFLVGEVLA